MLTMEEKIFGHLDTIAHLCDRDDIDINKILVAIMEEVKDAKACLEQGDS